MRYFELEIRYCIGKFVGKRVVPAENRRVDTWRYIHVEHPSEDKLSGQLKAIASSMLAKEYKKGTPIYIERVDYMELTEHRYYSILDQYA